MIKLFFNPASLSFEVYVNGVKAEGILNVKTDTENMGMPKATITAMVEIVNEKPK